MYRSGVSERDPVFGVSVLGSESLHACLLLETNYHLRNTGLPREVRRFESPPVGASELSSPYGWRTEGENQTFQNREQTKLGHGGADVGWGNG